MKNYLKYSMVMLLVIMNSIVNAQRYFLKVEGPNINGGNNATPHTGLFELSNFSFSISNSGTTHLGPTEGAGKSQSGPIQITLPFNEPNNKLYQAVHTGQNYDKITIYVRSYFPLPLPAGEKDYLIYSFEDVKFSSAESSYIDGGLIPSIVLSFKAGGFQIDFHTRLPDGSKSLTPSTINWNFLTTTSN